MASLLLGTGSLFFLYRYQASRCCNSSFRSAATRWEMATAAVIRVPPPYCVVTRGVATETAGPHEAGIRGTGRAEGQPRRKVVPGAAVAEVSGSFSGRRRIKAAAPTKSAQSLYAEELARCETAPQVLQLLFTSPNDGGSQQTQQQFSKLGRPNRENPTLPYLLPVDCLAFLNALLRVKQLRTSGSGFLFFCRVLEDTLQRYNARWVESFPTGTSTIPANDKLKPAFHEIRALQSIQDSGVHEGDDAVSGHVGIALLRSRPPPPHAGRFVRLMLQKLSDLKAPLAFTKMIPYLAPHVPTLAPFDVAECIWSFAVLQPPDWRSRHSPLLMQLLQRLLHVKSRLRPVEDPEANSCTRRTIYVRNEINVSSGYRRKADPCGALGEAEEGVGKGTTTKAAVAERREQTFCSKDAAYAKLLQRKVKHAELQTSLEWVDDDSDALKNKQNKHKREGTSENDEVLLLDDLSNLMIYRVTFGIAKLDFRCRIAQEVYQALASRVVKRLEEKQVEAFPPAYLEVIEDLSYKELKVVKHVYEALQINDRRFLSAVDLLLHQMRELNATEEGFAENPHRAARVKPFKTQPKRAALTDPVN